MDIIMDTGDATAPATSGRITFIGKTLWTSPIFLGVLVSLAIILVVGIIVWFSIESSQPSIQQQQQQHLSHGGGGVEDKPPRVATTETAAEVSSATTKTMAQYFAKRTTELRPGETLPPGFSVIYVWRDTCEVCKALFEEWFILDQLFINVVPPADSLPRFHLNVANHPNVRAALTRMINKPSLPAVMIIKDSNWEDGFILSEELSTAREWFYNIGGFIQQQRTPPPPQQQQPKHAPPPPQQHQQQRSATPTIAAAPPPPPPPADANEEAPAVVEPQPEDASSGSGSGGSLNDGA